MEETNPKILLLADKRDWAYDYAAHAIQKELSDEFNFQIFYVAEKQLEAVKSFHCDLAHIFWWGEDWHHALALPPARVLKEVSSFRWREEAQFGHLDPRSFVERYLYDAGTIVTTSRKMQDIITPYRPALYTPNGIDPKTFYPEGVRSGPMRVGWAGNINDACKGILDIIAPACEGAFQLVVAPGNIRSRDEMRAFYNHVDIFCVASTAEGQPLPLIESLACGCFPVTVDVGIVPEVIQSGENGLIIERSVAAFRSALSWCEVNLDTIRAQGSQRSSNIHVARSWQKVAHYWRIAYRQALAENKFTKSTNQETLSVL